MNELVQGVQAVIGGQFPNAPVVAEEDELPAEGGGFLVGIAAGSQEPDRRRLYRIVVRYGGATSAVRNEAADRLYETLRRIVVSGAVLKAAAMSHETVEGVLHFTVQYPVRVAQEQAAGIRMQTLSQEGVIG